MITTPTIFTGGDSKYWKQYGKSFVRSFKHFNPDKQVFVQIFNPDSNDINDLQSLDCKYQIETIESSYIDHLTQAHIKKFVDGIDDTLRSKLKTGMKFSEKNYGFTKLEDKMKHLITFSVYASFRFIRLSQYWNGEHPVVAYDMDTICNHQIDITQMLGNNDVGCLAVKGNRFVVSLVAFKNNCKLLKEWGNDLLKAFENETVYGFLDQDTFIKHSKNFNVKPIDRVYCDHTKKSASSYVITGKGTSKWGDTFQDAVNKWSV